MGEVYISISCNFNAQMSKFGEFWVPFCYAFCAKGFDWSHWKVNKFYLNYTNMVLHAVIIYYVQWWFMLFNIKSLETVVRSINAVTFSPKNLSDNLSMFSTWTKLLFLGPLKITKKKQKVSNSLSVSAWWTVIQVSLSNTEYTDSSLSQGFQLQHYFCGSSEKGYKPSCL